MAEVICTDCEGTGEVIVMRSQRDEDFIVSKRFLGLYESAAHTAGYIWEGVQVCPTCKGRGAAGSPEVFELAPVVPIR